MSSKTKIIVLHLKELIYTGIFVLLGLLFLVLIVIMFLPKKETDKPSYSGQEANYVPGKYTAALQLASGSVDVEVVVDEACISSIRLVNLSETVAAMYPLVEPCFADITEQICKQQSLENITWPDENRYTSQLLLDAIAAALKKATPDGL